MIGMTTAFSRQDRSSGAARSVKFGLGPVKMRWYMSRDVERREHDAQVAITAAGLLTWKVPASTRNSETKLDRPGSASDDNPATRKVPARTGVTRCQPP